MNSVGKIIVELVIVGGLVSGENSSAH